jgi:hypothetical protein
MKASITINSVLRLAFLMLLSLWAGYAAGYRHGVRDDQREWWASVRLDSQGNRVFLGPPGKTEFEAYFTRQNPIPDKLDK